MPIAMAIGAAMLPGTAAAQTATANGGLELCPGSAGGTGSSWGPLSSAVGIVDCSSAGAGMSFSLNNAATSNGAWGYDSKSITARVTGYSDGRLELQGTGGINVLNNVSMTSNKITDLAAGSAATDAVNVAQLDEAIRNANSGSPVVPVDNAVTYDTAGSDLITLKGANGTKITNLVDGDISNADSKDAVNGSQLFHTNQNVADVANNVAGVSGNLANVTNVVNNLAANGKYFNANSTLAGSSAGGTDSVAIGGAAVASAANSVALGSNSTADRANTVSVGANGAQRQIINVAAGSQDNDAVNLAQMEAAIANLGAGPGSPNAVVYDSATHGMITLGGAPTAPQVLVKNLAAGQIASGSTDAVNGDQLYRSASGLASALGAGAAVNQDGSITAPGYEVSGTTYNNIGDALSAINTAAGDLIGAAKYVKVVSSAPAALASGGESVAIGGGAMATKLNTLAIGTGATASFENSTAIGVNAVADESFTFSVGSKGGEMRITHVANGVDATDAVTVAQLNALQSQLTSAAPTSGVKSMMQAPAAVLSYIAVSSITTQGSATSASDVLNAMAIGPVAAATAPNAVAVGAGAAAGSESTTAIGSGAGALSPDSTAIGSSATVGALSDNSVSIGYHSRASSTNSLALGSLASATSPGSVSIGTDSFVRQGATSGVALGVNATVTAVNSVAIGSGAIADRAGVVSVGSASRQSQIVNVAAGTDSNDAVIVSQLSGVAAAIGGGAAVNPDGTIKAPAFTIGGQTYADVGSALAATADNSVQYDTSAHNKLTLGGTADPAPAVTLSNVANGVGDSDAVNVGQLKQLGMNLDSSGNLTNSFVAYDDTTLGAITLKGTNGTTLANVKAGELSAESSQAVNGGQLFQTNANVANVAGDLANVAGNVTNMANTINNIVVDGGGIKYFHANSTLADSSATGIDATAIGGAASATAANSVALGANSVADRANSVSVGAAGAARQIVNVANATNSTDAVNLSQLQALGANVDSDGVVRSTFVAYDDDTKNRITLRGAGSTEPVLLTNIGNGQLAASSSDAVNGAQLYNVAQSTAKALGGGANVLPDGSLSQPSYVITGSTYADVGSALSAVDGQLDQINTNFSTNLKYVKILSTAETAQASGIEAIAIGGNAMASKENSLAIGAGATASYANSTALGVNAVTDAENTLSVGAKGQEVRITHVAAGINPTDAATVGQLDALQTQLAANTGGVKSMMQSSAAVLSYIAVSSKVVLGGNTTASDDLNAMAIGPVASATGEGALAVGAGAIAGSAGSTAVGSAAGVASVNATAIGAGATVGALSDNAVSIGYNARASKTDATALGTTASATSAGSVAIGYGSFAAQAATGGMALGLNSTASAVNGVAIGNGAIADRENAISVGNAGKQSQIINLAAGTSNTDAVNLGQMTTAINAAVDTGTADGVIYDTPAHDRLTLGGSATSPAVRLTNVAAGTLTSTSSDAVNGSQLYNAASSVAAALGGNATVGMDGTVSAPKYTLNGQTYSDVGAALVAAANGGGSTSPEAVLYDSTSHDLLTLNTGGAAVTVSNVAAGVANNDAVNVGQLKALGANVDSSGNVSGAFVAYDDAGKTQVTLGGTTSTVPVVLANVGAGQITSNSTQAINGSQLYGAMNSAAAALGGGSKVNSDGQISKPVYTIDGATYNGVDSAVSALNAKIDTGSTNGVAYDTPAHDSLTLGGVGATTPVTIANVAAATKDDDAVNLKQLKDAGLNVDSSGNVITSFVTYDNADKTTLTFNAGGTATQLKNVAAGVDPTDAVNVGQMQSYVSTYVKDNGGGTANAVAYDDSSKSRLTLGGTDATAAVKLTNVADGTDATDAVNYGQFSSLQNQLNNIQTGDGTGGGTYFSVGTPEGGGSGIPAVASGSDSIAIGNGAAATGTESIAIGKNAVTAGDSSVALGSGATAPNVNSVALGAGSTTDRDNSVSMGSVGAERQITNVAAGTQGTDAVNLNQLNSAMGSMGNSIHNVDRNAAKGIASASALNIVTPYLPGRTTLNAGIANYRGYQAVGLGVSRWNEKGSINYNLGVSTSGGNSTIVRAGIGIVLGN